MSNRNIRRRLSEPSTPSAAAALAEAVGVVTRAHDDALEVDWTDNPKTEREAASPYDDPCDRAREH